MSRRRKDAPHNAPRGALQAWRRRISRPAAAPPEPVTPWVDCSKSEAMDEVLAPGRETADGLPDPGASAAPRPHRAARRATAAQIERAPCRERVCRSV